MLAIGPVEVLLVLLAGVGVLAVGALAALLLARRGARGRVEDRARDLLQRRGDVEERERRLSERDQQVSERQQQLEADRAALEERATALVGAEDEHRTALERVAGLSAEQARVDLVSSIEREAQRHGLHRAQDIEKAAVEQAEHRARGVLATAVQRLAGVQTSESVVTTVHLASEDMKGRIIGREGRNIRSFEQVTGVTLVIDETPESVVLSCFDPVRREVARRTLEELLADGRVHPARIEAVHERTVAEVAALSRRAGEEAAREVGVTGLHPRLVATLGALRYRTSYGQNVLGHLVESAHAAGLLADEIGVARDTCVRAAFLHDIGKALTHEVEGSHARVGADLARSHGESPEVVHAIEAHHNEVTPRTVEAVLTQAADAISAGRPGARRESSEQHSERLRRLEEIATAHPGVDRVYAMSAGRDVRVMVAPHVVDDTDAEGLALAIAREFETELTYPGQITVTVIRESRATATAH